MADSTADEARDRLLHHQSGEHDIEFGDLSATPRIYDSRTSLAETLSYSPVSPQSPPLHHKSPPSTGLGISAHGFYSGDHSPEQPFVSASGLQRGDTTSTHARRGTQRSVTFGDSVPGTPPAADFPAASSCPTSRPIWRSRRHWNTITILCFSVFSTVFSGIYLGIAIARPMWPQIRPGGSLDPQNASVLQIAFAKLIEVTFVTVFCAFLGQIVSRRAFMTQHGRGINLAEMNIRNWIVQPGSLISTPSTVRYAIWSVLGIVAMCAAICSVLYTTAAESLVSPQLSWDDWKTLDLYAEARAQFANSAWLGHECAPFPTTDDPNDSKESCLQLQHTAQAFSNYQLYKASWAGNSSGNGNQSKRSSDANADRPGPIAKWLDDVVVNGSWVERDHLAFVGPDGRMINNITLAIPHPGLVEAAALGENNIARPQGTEQIDNFQINASLPSPAMYVLCAAATASELAPLIWENAALGRAINVSTVQTFWKDFPPATFEPGSAYASGHPPTALDPIFQWGDAYNASGRRYPPFFAKLPIQSNSVMNSTHGPYGVDAVYMLIHLNVTQGSPSSATAHDYAVCSMKAGWVPYCSSHYSETGIGGTLEARCGDDENPLAYNKMHPGNDDWGQSMVQANWVDIAFEWANSLSFSQGINNANASSARLLSELFPQNQTLDTAYPSLAETLAVLGMNTVLMASKDTGFNPVWSYGAGEVFESNAPLETCEATMRVQRYASRPAIGSQEGFIVILLFVFVANFFILIWFLFFHRGLVTDYTEPANLFSLAINSPPSHDFAGACGGGPVPQQYRVRWFVNTDGEHVYLRSQDPGTPDLRKRPVKIKTVSTNSPASFHAERLSRQRWSIL